MKRHGNIYDKICSIENLREAHRNARKDKLFYKEVQMVDSNPDYYLTQIQEMLSSETYEVSEYTYSVINDKGKSRDLAKLPYFPDRIIQWAIMLQIEPVFMETFCYHTCASIKQRGISRVVDLMHEYLKDTKNTTYCFKMDVSKFYPSIDHDILKKLLRKKFKDKRLLKLLDKIIDSAITETGVPIGSYLSQYLANFYLSYFDHWMKEELHLKYVVRYMDDIVVLSSSKLHLHIVQAQVKQYLNTELNLTIKPNYQIFPVEKRGIDFVGFRFYHGKTLLRKSTYKKMKRKMRKILKKQMKNQLINYSEFCSINSYAGWLKLCDGYRLSQKYIIPVIPSLLRYYKEIILGNSKKSPIKKENAFIKYKENLIKKGLLQE
ncbi:MAG: RNA-directed DNA polymerase [Elusimicrobia bacterium]|nr:RNA-directed DNA polymerase [Elusimicrobiota bacterium]